MELNFKVRGADGAEYGPATLTEMTAWLRDSRINGETQVMRSDVDYWSRAADYAELQEIISGPSAVSPPALPAVADSNRRPGDPATVAQLKSGASWFFWIAGLSLVNSVVALTGSDWRFVLGLGITQFFDAIGGEFGGAGKVVVFILDLLAAGVFVLFGLFAAKQKLWAFVTGMILYLLDGGILLLAQDWLPAAFHGYALFCLFRGFKACRELKAS